MTLMTEEELKLHRQVRDLQTDLWDTEQDLALVRSDLRSADKLIQRLQYLLGRNP